MSCKDCKFGRAAYAGEGEITCESCQYIADRNTYERGAKKARSDQWFLSSDPFQNMYQLTTTKYQASQRVYMFDAALWDKHFEDAARGAFGSSNDFHHDFLLEFLYRIGAPMYYNFHFQTIEGFNTREKREVFELLKKKVGADMAREVMSYSKRFIKMDTL